MTTPPPRDVHQHGHHPLRQQTTADCPVCGGDMPPTAEVCSPACATAPARW
ncbi:hypothetical protein ABZ700_25810 [Streptomyces diastaticus]|uniref:hypothetical protein n=1 Tax=Streptomyces diastaticus TaxID=1956 RepID=UPI0033D65A6D